MACSLVNPCMHNSEKQKGKRAVLPEPERGRGTVQTGAGKTYTLSSIQPDAIGMMPRAAAEVFSDIANDAVHEYSVTMSYIQIYMELIQARRHAAQPIVVRALLQALPAQNEATKGPSPSSPVACCALLNSLLCSK